MKQIEIPQQSPIEVIDINENQWAVIGETDSIDHLLKEFAEYTYFDYCGSTCVGWVVSKLQTEKLNNIIPE